MVAVTRTVPAHSNNYFHDPTSRSGYRKIFIHSTRSGIPDRTDLELELASTLNWFQNPNAGASSHLVISPLETVRCVEDELPAGHASEDNFDSLAIELTQPIASMPYPDLLLARAAAATRSWCLEYAIPMVRLTEWTSEGRGIIGHEDSRQGLRVGKSDPGPMFPWNTFIGMVREEEATMTFEEFVRKWLGPLYQYYLEHPTEEISDAWNWWKRLPSMQSEELDRRLGEVEEASADHDRIFEEFEQSLHK